jgi:hypothetical protein
MKGSDAGDKHTPDLIFPRPVNDLGSAFDSRHIVVVSMTMADGNDISADSGKSITDGWVIGISNNSSPPISQPETGMSVPGDLHI